MCYTVSLQSRRALDFINLVGFLALRFICLRRGQMEGARGPILHVGTENARNREISGTPRGSIVRGPIGS